MVIKQKCTGLIDDLEVSANTYFNYEEDDSINFLYLRSFVGKDGSKEKYQEENGPICTRESNKKEPVFRASLISSILAGIFLFFMILFMAIFTPGPKCEVCGRSSYVLSRDDEYTCVYQGYNCEGKKGQHITYDCTHCGYTWHIVKEK
jgi:hypothetical protein